ncbi:MAG TPA: threonine--tRNA ligase [Candidatus Saccharimonadales bacterium]
MATTDDNLYAMRHSLAHILATALMHLYNDVKFGVGPVVEDGFYYDIDLGDRQLSEDDFADIESEMKAIIKQDLAFIKSIKPIDEAISWAVEAAQPYKVDLLNDLKRSGTTLANEIDAADLGLESGSDTKVEEVSFYADGDFTDLCRGPHVESTAKVGKFKLMRVSGAYWRGNDKNAQMQRVYGAAFDTQQELDDYLMRLEEAKKRDHRRLGQELDLYHLSDLIGPGLPLFTPRGTVLRKELIKYSEELQVAGGYQEIWAPHISRIDLYKTSGHYDKYPERFDVTSVESDDLFMIKPMNCPHVTQIFASRPRSYRDMPQRYMETTTMYRDEKSGELHGLSRVRSLTQDDSHAFVTHDQIDDEVHAVIKMVKQMYKTLDMSLSIELSFRDDSDRYFGDIEPWEKAQTIMEKIAKEEELDYKIELGEAAFYGPKIDIYVSDALNRRWQCATIQLDFVMPERFNLEYTDSEGHKQRPAMIHKAILGSIERFLSVYIEHTAGKFPVWVAPEQVRLITLNQSDEVVNFANQVSDKAKQAGIRLEVDNDNESVGKKIRNAEIMKVPYVIVIGGKEIETGNVTPRIRQDLANNKPAKELPIDNFIRTVSEEHRSRVTTSSLTVEV